MVQRAQRQDKDTQILSQFRQQKKKKKKKRPRMISVAFFTLSRVKIAFSSAKLDGYWASFLTVLPAQSKHIVKEQNCL
jgi:hypothetical protein